MQERILLTDENSNWLKKMSDKGINRSSVINLAIDILKPRLKNLGSSEDAIKTVIEEKKLFKIIDSENRPF